MEKMERDRKEGKAPWLSITLCCGEKRESIDGGDGKEVSRSVEETEMRICYEQPIPIAQPMVSPTQTRPVTSHSMSQTLSQWASQSREFATRASSRASVHTLTRPRKSHSRPRPSISRPMDFRHNDGDGIQSMLDDAPMPVRRGRRSFQPLELSIYLPDGRLSPLPDFDEDDWVKKPAQALVRNRDSRTESIASTSGASAWLIQRKPVGAGSRRSSIQSMRSNHSRHLSGGIATLPFLQEEEPKARTGSSASSPTSIQRSNTISPRRTVLSRLPSPSRSRANTAPSSRPSSIRRFKIADEDPEDVDAAIRELNTIVEERRADAYRSANLTPSRINILPASPSSHVPAIAPTLRMKVRSETLSDIGSAFSVPLATKPLPTPPTKPKSGLRLEAPKRTFSGPLDSNPITPPTPTVPTPTTPMHRLKGWLKRSLPPSPSSATLFKTTPSTPSFRSAKSSSSFYQGQNRTPTSSSHQRDISQQYFDMEPKTHSRPASSSSSSSRRTMTHSRHHSNETTTTTATTATVLSSYPSTPSLLSTTSSISTIRSLSPTSNHHNQHTPPLPTKSLPNTANTSKPRRRIPAPLNLTLAKEKELLIEACLNSAKSYSSARSSGARTTGTRRSVNMIPPQSPNYGLLRGMEICAVGEGVVPNQAGQRVLASPGAVGVAF